MRSEPYRELIAKLVEPRLYMDRSGLVGATKAADKADALEPSIIFATVTNTYGAARCMHINASVTQAVCGFDDGIVRVWRLGERAKPLDKTSMNVDAFAGTKRSISEVIPAPANQQPVLGADSDEPTLTLELVGHSGPVYGLSQDPHWPRLVLSSSADSKVMLWDVGAAIAVGKYQFSSPAWGVAMGPLGYYFAAATHDGSVEVHSVDKSQPLRIMTGHIADASCVQWHPNASLLLSGSDDRTCRLWDLRTGSCVRLLSGCPAAVSSVAVASCGGLAAGGCENGNTAVFDLTTGRMVHLLRGHSSYVNSVCFNDDDQVLGTGSSDGSVKVWSLRGHSAATDTRLLQPHKSFPTKYTPVLHVGYTDLNLMYAGGAFDVSSAPGTYCT
jgi:transcription initiation factor TFIID subunit 5